MIREDDHLPAVREAEPPLGARNWRAGSHVLSFIWSLFVLLALNWALPAGQKLETSSSARATHGGPNGAKLNGHLGELGLRPRPLSLTEIAEAGQPAGERDLTTGHELPVALAPTVTSTFDHGANANRAAALSGHRTASVHAYEARGPPRIA